MVYKIIVSPRAQKEIENAIDYYALYSPRWRGFVIRAILLAVCNDIRDAVGYWIFHR